MTIKKKIEVVPYNPSWPETFAQEAKVLREALGDKALEIHHVGSTSVMGLDSKPIIDVILVAENWANLKTELQKVGYIYKGEFNIPLHWGFSKTTPFPINLHGYEPGHSEIELNLKFRDFLRKNPNEREAYARLKYELLKDPASYTKTNSSFTGYNLGKNKFINSIIRKSGFKRLRITKCAHYSEQEVLQKFYQDEGINPPPLDPNFPPLILYQGADIIGLAHVKVSANHSPCVSISLFGEGHNCETKTFFECLIRKWIVSLQ